MLLAALAGCSYSAALPTSPTTPATAVTPVVAAIELLPPADPDFASGVAMVGIRTRDRSGAIIGADVTCSPSSGQLFPGRFDSRLRGSIELAGATTRTRITCSSGATVTAVDVDMSAWSVDLVFNDFAALGPQAGLSRVLLLPRQRIANIPATRLTIDWGDGSSDVSPFVPAATPRTMAHTYRAAGLYLATGRIDWPGGSYERALTIAGGPGS